MGAFLMQINSHQQRKNEKEKLNMEENENLTGEEFMAESPESLSEEMSEAAEPNTNEESAEVEEQVETEQPEQTEAQNDVVDRNAIYAEARRVAEANARKAQKAIDDDFARRFSGYTNPETGQPIRSQADYLAALDAQDRMQARAQLQQQGVDPSILDNAISNALANNPAIRQAEAVMQQAKQERIFGEIGADVQMLHELDPSINTVFDVPPDVVKIVLQSNGNIRLVDAYKIANYGKVSQNQQAAIKQQAINQAKGKQHLSPVNGVSTPDEGVEIPESELAMWKESFPDKSKAELKKLYNKTLQ